MLDSVLFRISSDKETAVLAVAEDTQTELELCITKAYLQDIREL